MENVTRVPVIVEQAKGYDGLIIPSKNNPENGAIMLRSIEESVSDNGFLSEVHKVGLFKGRVESLERLIKKYGLKNGVDFNEAMPMKVRLVLKESTTPFYEGQDPKVYPANSDRAGEVITHNGEDVYRVTQVVSEASAEKDALLTMDREEQTIERTQTVFSKEAEPTEK